MAEKNVFETIDDVPAGTYQNQSRLKKINKTIERINAKRKAALVNVKKKSLNIGKWRNLTKFSAPTISTPKTIVFTPAPTRVNVLSTYGNEKFYPQRNPKIRYIR